MPEEGPSAWVGPPSTRVRPISPERPPLPSDPDACPPLDVTYATALDRALATAGLVLDPAARAGIDAHVRLLMAWNAAINLTAIRVPAAVAVEHVADSLSALPLLRAAGAPGRPTLLDLGSGGGYPGLPLGLALPAGRLALVESVVKKARFLEVAGRAAGATMRAAGGEPPAVEVLATRAEALAADVAHRGRWDVVTARAVAALDELVELALPLVTVGGLLVAWKRDAGDGALDAEFAAAGPVLAAVGGKLEAVERVGVPGLEDHRLVVVRAVAPAPARFPRSPAERRRGRAG
jgi:16S rRNA (guanine527-N7)-methyltransferase